MSWLDWYIFIPTVIAYVLTSVLGFLRLKSVTNEIVNDINFLTEYYQKLDAFTKDLQRDQWDGETFLYLAENAREAQIALGTSGIIFSYRPAFSNTVYSNYPILINTIPQLRTGDYHPNDVNWCINAFLSQIGSLKASQVRILKDQQGVFKHFVRGIRAILEIPVELLVETGLMSNKAALRTKNNWIFNALAGLFSMVGILSSFVTIGTSVTPLKALLHQWFPQWF